MMNHSGRNERAMSEKPEMKENLTAAESAVSSGKTETNTRKKKKRQSILIIYYLTVEIFCVQLVTQARFLKREI